jgi:hypothetical protein
MHFTCPSRQITARLLGLPVGRAAGEARQILDPTLRRSETDPHLYFCHLPGCLLYDELLPFGSEHTCWAALRRY